MPVIYHRLVGFDFNYIFFAALIENAHKKSVAFFAFIGCFEVLDYLNLPITTYKPTPFDGCSAASFWEIF